MNKKIKIILSILCVVLCLSLSVFTAFAVEQGNNGSSSYEEVTDAPTDPVVTEPETDPPTEEPTDPPTQEPTYAPTEEPTDYEPDTEDTYTDAPKTDYYFDPDVDSNYTYNTESETSEQAELYKTDDKVDTNVLNDDDWAKIALSLQNADGSGDGDDFSFIKNNTASGDSGHWYLYLGITFLVLSLGGFVLAYMSWHQQKKRFAKAGSNRANRPGGNGSASGKTSANNRYSKTSKPQSAQRDRGDYGDSYSQKRTTQRKKTNHKLDDTADVRLPDDYKGRHF